MTDPAELDDWARELSEALGLPADAVDVALVLNLARDAAHGVARPAAPLTTFLVGYAAARAGGGRDQVQAAAEIASRLAADRA
jgi:hypothetical protein